ncbi:PixA protein [Escherichia coli]|nr:PixA protein [Escherichia coli]
MNKVIIATMLASTVSFGVNAANQGQGVINFKGTVIDAPCGIAQESADQTINFGQISKAHLNADGISVKKDLDIKLVNCDATEIGKTDQWCESFFYWYNNQWTESGVRYYW